MQSKFLFAAIVVILCFGAKASADEVILIPYEGINIPVVVASLDGEPGPGPGHGEVIYCKDKDEGTIFVPEVSYCSYFAYESATSSNYYEADEHRSGYDSCPDYSGVIQALYSWYDINTMLWWNRWVTQRNLPLKSQVKVNGGCWVNG
ncbi:hypothetical protein ACJJIX_19300 [Microbulbifer sp. VAAC004]|uniref:hypothetical protein n=1 Tax=unclassified Microbulbifer TaxID=2619833 RepID=UPI00403922F2